MYKFVIHCREKPPRLCAAHRATHKTRDRLQNQISASQCKKQERKIIYPENFGNCARTKIPVGVYERSTITARQWPNTVALCSAFAAQARQPHTIKRLP
jgi:hypothetical protein